jgi:hypothetical protein
MRSRVVLVRARALSRRREMRSCNYKRQAALRSGRSRAARARAAHDVREFVRLGCAPLLVGTIREAEIARRLGVSIERSAPGATTDALRNLIDRLESFCRFLRRNRRWLRSQITAAEKEKAPTRER